MIQEMDTPEEKEIQVCQDNLTCSDLIMDSLSDMYTVIENMDPENFDQPTADLIALSLNNTLEYGGAESETIVTECLGVMGYNAALESVGEWIKKTATAGVEIVKKLIAKIKELVGRFIEWIKSKFAKKPNINTKDTSGVKDPKQTKPSEAASSNEQTKSNGAGYKPKPTVGASKLSQLTASLVVNHKPIDVLKQHIAFGENIVKAQDANFNAGSAVVTKFMSVVEQQAKVNKEVGRSVAKFLEEPFKLALPTNGHLAKADKVAIDKSLVDHVLTIKTFKSTALGAIDLNCYHINPKPSTVSFDDAAFESIEQMVVLADLCNHLKSVLDDVLTMKSLEGNQVNAARAKFMDDFTVGLDASGLEERNKTAVMHNVVKFMQITTTIMGPTFFFLPAWNYLNRIHSALSHDLVKHGFKLEQIKS